MTGRTLATRSIPAERLETMPEEVGRALLLSLRTEMRERGFAPDDYVVELVRDPALDVVTLACHEVDPMTRCLSYDDRGIL